MSWILGGRGGCGNHGWSLDIRVWVFVAAWDEGKIGDEILGYRSTSWKRYFEGEGQGVVYIDW